MKILKSVLFLLFGVLLLLTPRPAQVASYLWQGTNTDWFNAANWKPNGVPGPGDSVEIYNSTFWAGNNPNNAAGEIQDLTIGACNGIELGGTLMVKGSFNFNNGELRGGTLVLDAGATMNFNYTTPCQDGCTHGWLMKLPRLGIFWR